MDDIMRGLDRVQVVARPNESQTHVDIVWRREGGENGSRIQIDYNTALFSAIFLLSSAQSAEEQSEYGQSSLIGNVAAILACLPPWHDYLGACSTPYMRCHVFAGLVSAALNVGQQQGITSYEEGSEAYNTILREALSYYLPLLANGAQKIDDATHQAFRAAWSVCCQGVMTETNATADEQSALQELARLLERGGAILAGHYQDATNPESA